MTTVITSSNLKLRENAKLEGFLIVEVNGLHLGARGRDRRSSMHRVLVNRESPAMTGRRCQLCSSYRVVSPQKKGFWCDLENFALFVAKVAIAPDMKNVC